jgi:hypothetical protein
VAKVTVVPNCPEIVPYMNEDEDIFFVGTFDEAKQSILSVLEEYIKRLEHLTYKEWKSKEYRI